MSTHKCSVPGCGIELRPHILMCRVHWRKVPYPLRSKVWVAWEEFQCGHISLPELRAVQAEATDTVSVSKGGAR